MSRFRLLKLRLLGALGASIRGSIPYEYNRFFPYKSSSGDLDESAQQLLVAPADRRILLELCVFVCLQLGLVQSLDSAQ